MSNFDEKIKYNRSNKNLYTISQWYADDENDFEGDYDTSDVDFDLCVTICEPLIFSYNIKDNYDKYVQYIYDNVNVVCEKTDETNVVCDWSEFVYRNYDELREFSEKYWEHTPEDTDDFVYEWVKETNAFLAGQVGENTYDNFLQIMKKHDNNHINEHYREFLNDTIVPNVTEQTLIDYVCNQSFPRSNLQREMLTLTELPQVNAEYKTGRAFPNTIDYTGVQNYRIIADTPDVVLGVTGTGNYATWEREANGGLCFGHYYIDDEKGAKEDYVKRLCKSFDLSAPFLDKNEDLDLTTENSRGR